jgi:hypothetical protein
MYHLVGGWGGGGVGGGGGLSRSHLLHIGQRLHGSGSSTEDGAAKVHARSPASGSV